jgi:organic radical activating enzyme
MGSRGRIVEIATEKPYLSVTWKVSNYCNYACEYCNPNNRSGKFSREDNLQDYIDALDDIFLMYLSSGYKNVKFFFTGGEPTVWNNFIPLCSWIKEKFPQASITVETNLSRPLSWWEENHRLFDEVLSSFHIEFAQQDKYLEKAYFLCDKLAHLGHKLMLDDRRFWEVVEFAETLKQSVPNYYIEYVPLTGVLTTEEIYRGDEEIMAFIDSHRSPEMDFTEYKPVNKSTDFRSEVRYADGSSEECNGWQLSAEQNNVFKGWECDIGDNLFIGDDGCVSMAGCGTKFRIGHILNDRSNIVPETVICDKQACWNGSDIVIPKRLPQFELINAVQEN